MNRAARRAAAKARCDELTQQFGVPFGTAWRAVSQGIADRCVSVVLTRALAAEPGEAIDRAAIFTAELVSREVPIAQRGAR